PSPESERFHVIQKGQTSPVKRGNIRKSERDTYHIPDMALHGTLPFRMINNFTMAEKILSI
ncbi:MAG: hypothetical protein J6P40_02170, partial [Oscillospiraceae bacterium]|nr:hypothetical protein [Oscillospiraceae bacterium]